MRVGEGEYQRDSIKSQFNYLWHSLESAIERSITPTRGDKKKRHR